MILSSVIQQLLSSPNACSRLSASNLAQLSSVSSISSSRNSCENLDRKVRCTNLPCRTSSLPIFHVLSLYLCAAVSDKNTWYLILKEYLIAEVEGVWRTRLEEFETTNTSHRNHHFSRNWAQNYGPKNPLQRPNGTKLVTVMLGIWRYNMLICY